MQKNKCRVVILLCLAWANALSPAHAAAPKKKKSSWLQNISKTLDTGTSRQPTTVAGVRGLDEPGGPVNTSARNYAAIDRLEKVQVTPEELKQFLAEGKLP